MSELHGVEPIDLGQRPRNQGESHPRAFGSPLPVGSSGQAPASQDAVPPIGRALANAAGPSSDDEDYPSNAQRAMSMLRMALPLVQRVLPLIEGNVASAVANLLVPRPHTPPPAAPVNLDPIENGLADLRTEHRELHTQVGEQNSALKHVADQLEMVREATDRNTLEQQELLEDLKSVGSKVNMFAFLALLLLAVSLLVNVVLFLHIQRVLP